MSIPTPPATVTEQVLVERVVRLGKQRELRLVEFVTAVIAVVSVVGPPSPSLHVALGTAGVRLWGIGMAAVTGVFFTVVARERRHPPRLLLLERAALWMQIVMWGTYIGLTASVHPSGYTTTLAIGALAGVLLLRITEITQDIRHPRWKTNPALIVPDPGGPPDPAAADPP